MNTNKNQERILPLGRGETALSQTPPEKSGPPTRAKLAFSRVLMLGGVVGVFTFTSGCFSSWVSPTSHIAPPATKIAPLSMEDSGLPPTSLPTEPNATAPRTTLLTAPLPRDLPQIPFSQE